MMLSTESTSHSAGPNAGDKRKLRIERVFAVGDLLKMFDERFLQATHK